MFKLTISRIKSSRRRMLVQISVPLLLTSGLQLQGSESPVCVCVCAKTLAWSLQHLQHVTEHLCYTPWCYNTSNGKQACVWLDWVNLSLRFYLAEPFFHLLSVWFFSRQVFRPHIFLRGLFNLWSDLWHWHFRFWLSTSLNIINN